SHTSSLYFLTDPPPPAIYTLSLHDALPIWQARRIDLMAIEKRHESGEHTMEQTTDAKVVVNVDGSRTEYDDVSPEPAELERLLRDRKSTRLNSSHLGISYAVFCLKKKNNRI